MSNVLLVLILFSDYICDLNFLHQPIHHTINVTMVTIGYKFMQQEIKINWDDEGPPVQDTENKKEMGQIFTDELLENDAKKWYHRFASECCFCY